MIVLWRFQRTLQSFHLDPTNMVVHLHQHIYELAFSFSEILRRDHKVQLRRRKKFTFERQSTPCFPHLSYNLSHPLSLLSVTNTLDNSIGTLLLGVLPYWLYGPDLGRECGTGKATSLS
jgi:hypothetical protein